VGYIVTSKGAVSDLEVLSATPPGVFEKAATNAVSRLRYKPSSTPAGRRRLDQNAREIRLAK